MYVAITGTVSNKINCLIKTFKIMKALNFFAGVLTAVFSLLLTTSIYSFIVNTF